MIFTKQENTVILNGSYALRFTGGVGRVFFVAQVVIQVEHLERCGKSSRRYSECLWNGWLGSSLPLRGTHNLHFLEGNKHICLGGFQGINSVSLGSNT